MLQQEFINRIVSIALSKTVIQADFQMEQLHGGTLGDVRLVYGTARMIDGEEQAYRLVWKRQKKWDRPGDPESWRREYDFYNMGLEAFQAKQFRWPICYHSTISNDETQLWLEYIEGVSGFQLTIEMLEQSAENLGSFQGMLYAQQNSLKELSFLSKSDTMLKEYQQWKPDTVEFQYLRSDDCSIPDHLRKMLIDTQEHSEQLFQHMENLPIVLCHKDFWHENLILANDEIVLIDWDCVGWGYLGEDIASLIADDTETDHLIIFYQRLIPAYLRGIRSHMGISWIENHFFWEMMVVKYGYRILQAHQFAGSTEGKAEQVKRLQTLYEMQNM